MCGLLEQAGAKIFDETGAAWFDAHTIEVGGEQPNNGGADRHRHRRASSTAGYFRAPNLAIVSDDAFYLPDFPKRVAIIGGGYIAVEFAGIFAGLGAETHMIYRQPLPLRGFDEDVRVGLAEALDEQRHPALSRYGAEIHYQR